MPGIRVVTMPTSRRCVDCPRLIPAGSPRGRCPDCLRERERERGSRQDRGYGADHDRERSSWQRRMDAGETVACRNPYCLSPSSPVDPRRWHLGHAPDRAAWRGPEHPECNLTEAGKGWGVPPRA